jgi:hypothetical protein
LNDFGVVNENESVDERDHNSTSMSMDFNDNHDQECLSSIMIDTEKNNSLVENSIQNLSSTSIAFDQHSMEISRE